MIRWELLNNDQRRLCEHHGHRLVRRLIHTEDDGVEEIIFCLASNGGTYTVREWLSVLNNLEGCEQTLDHWLSEEQPDGNDKNQISRSRVR